MIYEHMGNNVPGSSFVNNQRAIESYIDAKEAALFIGLSARTLMRLARTGVVPGHAIGIGVRHRWRFLKSELDIWMQTRLNSHHHLRSPKEEFR